MSKFQFMYVYQMVFDLNIAREILETQLYQVSIHTKQLDISIMHQ